MEFVREPFGAGAERITLRAPDGTALSVLTYGAAVQRLVFPDESGEVADAVLGFPTLDQYVARPDLYLGIVAGRYANRIANGSFELDGRSHALNRN
jgi:aldose 1-epimerase